MTLIMWGYLAILMVAIGVWGLAWRTIAIKATRRKWWTLLTTVAAGISLVVMALAPVNLQVVVQSGFIAGMLLVIGWWPRGLSDSGLVVSMAQMRGYAGLSGVELQPVGKQTNLVAYSGQVPVSRLTLQAEAGVVQAFLVTKVPADRIIIVK